MDTAVSLIQAIPVSLLAAIGLCFGFHLRGPSKNSSRTRIPPIVRWMLWDLVLMGQGVSKLRRKELALAVAQADLGLGLEAGSHAWSKERDCT